MKRVAKYSLAYLAYVTALHLIPGPWKQWKVGRAGRATDPWTLQHLLWGALGKAMGLSLTEVMVLSVANEALEAGVRRYRPDLLWGTPETPKNVVVDLLGVAAGWQFLPPGLGPPSG